MAERNVGQFDTPKGLAYDSLGYLYVVDSGNNRISLALPPSVIGASGAAGSGLGQFQGPVNLGVGSRWIYVADTGNNRVEEFDPVPTATGASQTPFISRGSLSSELSLSQPNSIALAADLLEEKAYVADAGNNRVLLVKLPGDDPMPVWNSMVAAAAATAGDISGAVSSFSSSTAEAYRQAFLTIGISDLISDISQIGSLTPVFIRNDMAEYYFEQTVDGLLLLFRVEFVNENGVWKISEF